MKPKHRKETSMTDKVQKIIRNSDYHDFNREADGFTNEIRDVIDSLRKEPVSEDVEEIAWNLADKKCHLDIAVFTPDEVKKERRKMQFTWQDLYDAVIFGAKWKEKRMMAKAINTEASFTMSVPSICISLPLGVNVGDKVKVIVIKED